jgi:hypothetical protein
MMRAVVKARAPAVYAIFPSSLGSSGRVPPVEQRQQFFKRMILIDTACLDVDWVATCPEVDPHEGSFSSARDSKFDKFEPGRKRSDEPLLGDAGPRCEVRGHREPP